MDVFVGMPLVVFDALGMLQGYLHAVEWLWKLHNDVSARLSLEVHPGTIHPGVGCLINVPSYASILPYRCIDDVISYFGR